MIGDVAMGTHKISGLPTPGADSEAATKKYVDDAIAASSGGGYQTGDFKIFGGGTTPSGWLACDGAAVSRATYAALFAVIGEQFGVGNGTTTFNVPNVAGRSIIGTGTGSYASPTARVRGAAGGLETHTLTTPEIPAHTHTAQGGDSGGALSIPDWSDITCAAITRNVVTTATGGGGSHNNMQPYLAVPVFIKT